MYTHQLPTKKRK